MSEEPRRYASEIERRRRPLKDVDTPARARLLKAGAWLMMPAVGISIVLTYYFVSSGVNPLLAIVYGIGIGAGGPIGVFALLYFVGGCGTASLLHRIYHGGSTGTPLPDTLWKAQAASVRGRHDDALLAYEEAVARAPDDPAPYLRAAAYCVEERGDPKLAATWYERALKLERLEPETSAYTCVRLADIYESLGEDGRAMAALRRLLTLHPDSQYAKRARIRLAALKRERAESERPQDAGPIVEEERDESG